MKVIKEEDLLFLHKQIEKSEVKQQKLEELLDYEADKLKKSRKTNRMYRSISMIFLLSAIFLVANAFYSSKKSSKAITSSKKLSTNQLSVIQEELETTKKELALLRQKNAEIEEIKNLYLYRNLINKETVYSVQIKAVNDSKTPVVSEKYTNALVYSDEELRKFSLGIFETLEEAQAFRKTLIKSGLYDKRIFVISYKDGKRIKIEDFQ